MRVLHDSRSIAHRNPFGAAPLGGTVSLAVDVYDDFGAHATLRLWVEGEGERYQPMERCEVDGHLRFRTELTPGVLELHWYCFIVEGSDGHVAYVGPHDGATGGESMVTDYLANSYQITVYRERAVYPEWWERAIVYQIFPDRFNRGARWEEQVVGNLELARGGVRRRLVDDWSTPPAYDRGDQGSMNFWDFYGGTLDGITEKLDYLANLGITALYLNPIFTAQSNHRYDTGDYLHVSPMLGGDEAFERLAMACATRDISIVLDGVFNHSGIDSIYFNAFGNYDSYGAGQGLDSPYHDWYVWREDGTHDAWWGARDLPAFNKDNPGYRALIYGPCGVVPTWLRRGARGWRLDVADELTDELIAHIRRAAADTKPDSLVLGEVWEDASHKVSYGTMRHYLQGEELDGVMNYPFRVALLGYLRGEWSAWGFADAMETLRENYPPHALRCSMNLLGSHDRARVLTMLGGAPDPDSLDDWAKRTWRIPDEMMGVAKGRLWLALLVQMSMPGAPSVYYGDEAGLQGMTDPYNRATFPWGHEDPDTMAMVRNAIDFRRTLEVLTSGESRVFSQGEDLVCVERTLGDERVVVLVNRSLSNTVTAEIAMSGECVDELVGSRRVEVSGDGRRCLIPLWPLGSAALYFHPTERLAKPLPSGAGVCCAITSVPREGGPGTLGAPARAFVDFLARCGQRYWQILPVNPTDAFGSPYAGSSAFAGNAALLDLGGRTLEEMVASFEPGADFARFLEQEADWLVPYAAYEAIRNVVGIPDDDEEAPDLDAEADPRIRAEWGRWPEEYRRFDPALATRPELADHVRFHEVMQYLFATQWATLRDYAASQGISIIGDMPFYVSANSADAWAHPELFKIAADGRLEEVSGYPPDGMAAEGQVWGNPIFDWEALAADNYHWWIERLRRCLTLYDALRLDHFLGYGRYWSVPSGQSATAGHWVHGPGLALFEAAHRELGALPLIVEDLGDVTPASRALLAETGFLGMDIAIFAESDIRERYLPKRNAIAYTSTHDTTTLVGWVEERFYPDANLSSHGRARVDAEGLEEPAPHYEQGQSPLDLVDARETLEREKAEARQVAADIAERVLASDADVVIQQLQDVLLLDAESRMNVPGTVGGNWRWQATEAQLAEAAPRLAAMTERCGR